MAKRFNAVLPRKPNFRDYINEIEDALDDILDFADEQFEKTYSTWKRQHQPDFDRETKAGSRRVSGKLTTSGDGSRDNPYPFVTRGTRVRYATMTPDFQAKTTPRVIGSGPGRGGLLYVNKNRPRPGIEAREFEIVIQGQVDKKVPGIADKLIRKIAKRSGHGL
jgi:hypothetical protein